jgi:hypothetical protein
MSLTHMTATEYRATINALENTLTTNGKLLEALEALDSEFCGLTEAQQNTFDNAEFKYDEAVKSLTKLGVLAISWKASREWFDK